MNTLKMEKKIQILNALVEGNSIRSTERMTGCHRDTILKLLVEVGDKCQEVSDSHIKDFHSRLIQVDEIWTFVGKKEKKLTDSEKDTNLLGDQYCFVSMDAETKLIPNYEVGKRNLETTLKFISNLKEN